MRDIAAAKASTVETVTAEQLITGHTTEVTGIFIDATNTILLSCSLGTVRCRNYYSTFYTKLPLHTYSI
jgi:hypothetical protein